MLTNSWQWYHRVTRPADNGTINVIKQLTLRKQTADITMIMSAMIKTLEFTNFKIAHLARNVVSLCGFQTMYSTRLLSKYISYSRYHHLILCLWHIPSYATSLEFSSILSYIVGRALLHSKMYHTHLGKKEIYQRKVEFLWSACL